MFAGYLTQIDFVVDVIHTWANHLRTSQPWLKNFVPCTFHTSKGVLSGNTCEVRVSDGEYIVRIIKARIKLKVRIRIRFTLHT